MKPKLSIITTQESFLGFVGVKEKDREVFPTNLIVEAGGKSLESSEGTSRDISGDIKAFLI